MLQVLLPPPWLSQEDPTARPIQGYFSLEEMHRKNREGYNVYFYPNYPSITIDTSTFLKGHEIDVFEWVFVDLDMKHGEYASKEDFLFTISEFTLPPTKVIDSGNGIHAYWRISDLDAINYLKLQRRLMRHFKTDDAVAKIKQLMRVTNTMNTKEREDIKRCELLYQSTDAVYTCENLDNALAPITYKDEQYCEQHFNKTYNIETKSDAIQDTLPLKFAKLLDANKEVKDIWSGNTNDRSKGDYRLGHIMFASGFTREEAASVLVNSAKAITRAPVHRVGYATDILDKIWTAEITNDKKAMLSNSVEEILMNKQGNGAVKFSCNTIVDGTHAGFKLGQVFGLVGGSGVGKTTFALNLFKWFVESNPEFVHFFVSLEQPVEEIANRWVIMCGDNKRLHSKVQVLGNYNEDGTYRNLSLPEIKDYILAFEARTGSKVGCVVLDHIGILKKNSSNGESQALMDICQSLKSFAVETKTFFVVQSQTNREKAGIGDLELNKDAAFGTTSFEWYCDFLVTIWCPLKRVYDKAPHMTVTAFKFCKIRDKNIKLDKLQEDQRYTLMFDIDTEHYRPLTEEEEKSFTFFNNQATSLRKQDRKTDVLEYKSVRTLKV